MSFVTVLLAPLLLSISAGGSSSMDMELGLVLGLVPTSMLVVVIVMASRVRSLTTAFGIERLMRLHRYLGLFVVVLVLLHLGMVIVADPRNVRLLDLLHAPPRARAATVATIGLLLIAGLAVFRRRMTMRYELWRAIHVLLAAVIIIGAALHVFWLNHLIQNPAMAVVFGVLLLGVLAVLIHRWVVRPVLAGRNQFRVQEIRRESEAVSTLVLAPAGRRRPGRREQMAFAPGQFAWLRLHRSVLVAEEHPFTIASGALAEGMIEFTIRHVGDYTRLLSHLHPGQTVYLDGPHGTFSVDHTQATGLVLIAGGVGITPMMSMLRTLAARGDRRPHRLVVSGRTPSELLFSDEIRELTSRLNLTVVQTVTQPPEGWVGPTGRIGRDLLEAVLPGPFRRNQLDYFLCGSPALVGGALTALEELDIPAQRVHTEQFDMV
ncbi:ferric reductase-like transmembrane domain-containing protein [Pseudonocardia acidicola]|uniref:Ferredoxin reductase family protein n=1 Tax=Pseudonocardia acidicola TaxID=2724939 RepID=A0ABX1SK15_9PSEU|nr:ferredoxin reductase family protein [Pseudonocardia acidicola]NMI01401.1 ferredoxin reductase family protein [Pseudonocardia acidicola]